MEYLHHGDLQRQRDSEAGLSMNQKIRTLVQSLDALTYLYGQKRQIVHRDIKPENILIKQVFGPIQHQAGRFRIL